MSGVEVRDLAKQWGGTRAVNGVSFTAHENTLTVLLGPSGCGKSTILRMIAGLENASEGVVLIGDKDVTRLDPSRRGVSMVFQSYALFPHLDVRENILFGLKVRRVGAAEQRERLDRAARMVGLEELLDRKPAQLSGGQRQRVALARTVVANQPVCLMDEPLSNLDAKLRAEMRDEVRRLQQNLHLTLIYVTHDQTEAMSMADQVVLLREGNIVQTGTPAELYERPANEFAARFLGTPPMNVLDVDRLDLPGERANGGHFLGIRPEKVVPTDTGFPVEVSAVDYMGAETVLRLSHGGATLMARLNGRSEAAPGDRLHVRWDPADVHWFDREGVRLEGT